MAFNSPELLEAWIKTGKYPEIHAPMTLAAQGLQGKRVLDLCCSFGLLGSRLKATGQFDFVMGVDFELAAIDAGLRANLPIDQLIWFKLDPGSMPVFEELVTENKIDAIVARRAFPELFSADHDFGRHWALRMNQLGVREILLEGRIASHRTSNSLGRLADEIALFERSYHRVPLELPIPNVALLRAN